MWRDAAHRLAWRPFVNELTRLRCFCLAQHYLTMLGSTVLIPFLLVPAMGGTTGDLAKVGFCCHSLAHLVSRQTMCSLCAC